MDSLQAITAFNRLLDALVAQGLADSWKTGSKEDSAIRLDGNMKLVGPPNDQHIMWYYGPGHQNELDVTGLQPEEAIAKILAVSPMK